MSYILDTNIVTAVLKENERVKKTPVQDADILIAATAITQNLILVSGDSDMLRIQNITVENWLRTEY